MSREDEGKGISKMEVKKKEKKTTHSVSFRKRGILFFAAVLSAMAAVLTLGVPEVAEEGINHPAFLRIYEVIEQLEEGFADQGMLLTLLSIGLYAIYKKVWMDQKVKVIACSRGLALLLAVLFAGGEAFLYGGRLSLLVDPEVNRIKTVILVVGFFALYLTAINYLYVLLHKNSVSKEYGGFVIRIYRKHPFFSVWAGIMAVWSFHLLLRYPGAMSYDNWDQLAQYFGVNTYSTSQPIFHTWLFGSFIRFGTWLGSCNLGLFSFVLFQSAIMAAVLAYSLLFMRRWRTPVWLRVLTMAICCIAPYYTGYAAFPIKDYLYTAFYLLLVLGVMNWIKAPDGFWKNRWQGVLWVLSAGLMILFRKNGIYVYFIVAAFILAYECIRLTRSRKQPGGYRRMIPILVCLLLPFLLVKGTETVLIKRYQVQQDSPKEMFSLPFQQTARYVKQYGEEIPEEERAVIAKVLDYEALPEIYSSLTADPVKTTYHAQNTGEVLDYLKVWIKQFFRHPLCYLEATWNQNYYIFAPNVDNIVYNKNCYAGAEIVWNSEFYDRIHFEIPEGMPGLDQIAVSFYALLTRLPIIGMLNNVAFYTILMFVILFFMGHDKRYKELLAMVPLLVSFLFVLMAPQIQDQPRYAFPIIYAMPVMTAFYRSACKNKVPLI